MTIDQQYIRDSLRSMVYYYTKKDALILTMRTLYQRICSTTKKTSTSYAVDRFREKNCERYHFLRTLVNSSIDRNNKNFSIVALFKNTTTNFFRSSMKNVKITCCHFLQRQTWSWTEKNLTWIPINSRYTNNSDGKLPCVRRQLRYAEYAENTNFTKEKSFGKFHLIFRKSRQKPWLPAGHQPACHWLF